VRSQLSFQLPKFKEIKTEKNNNFPVDTSKTKKKKRKNENGIFYGINMGMYKANKYTAQYYNGTQRYGYLYNTDNIMQYTLFDNTNNYNTIKQALNVPDFTLSGLPSNMHYSPALMIGLYAKYRYKNSGFFLQFDFSKLTAKDVFTLSYYSSYIQMDSILTEPITGTEQRASIDLGYSYTFKSKSNVNPYIEFGVNLNSTKFGNNQIVIKGNTYSIADPRAAIDNLNQGGIGFGGFAGSGIELVFNETVAIIPGFDFYVIKTKLGYPTDQSLNTSNYNAYFYKFKPNYSIFLRVILNGLFSSN